MLSLPCPVRLIISIFVVGQYCPEGSSMPLGCDPGKYCHADAMSAPQGPCAAGYYCTANSTTDKPSGTGGK